MRVLILTVDAGGNTPPTRLLAQALVAAGHELSVLGHPNTLEGYPTAERAAWRHTRHWDPRAADGAPWRMLDWLALATDRGYAADLASHRWAPDLVVVDCMIPAAQRPARAFGVPVVQFAHTLSDYWVRQWSGASPLNAWVRARHTHPASVHTRADAVLLATSPTLDDASALKHLLGVPMAQVGPLVPTPAEPPTGPPPTLATGPGRRPASWSA